MNNLEVFNANEVLLLLPEDVVVEFKGDFLVSAKDVANMLGYSQTIKFVELIRDKYQVKLKPSDLRNREIRKINNAGETFITSFGLNQGVANSRMEKAEHFQDWLYEDLLPTIQKTGKYDTEENEILNIPDEKERELKLHFKRLEEVVKANPSDMLSIMAYKDAENKLEIYLQNKLIEEVKQETLEQKQEINRIVDSSDSIKETMQVISGEKWRKEINGYIKGIAMEGFSGDHKDARNILYTELNNRTGSDIHRRLKFKKDRLIKAGATKTVIGKTNLMDVIEDDDKLREVFTLIVKEAYMKYCG